MSITTVADVEAAAARIAGAVVRTPLLRAGWGDPRRPLFLKPESLQPTGAFKLRGATNAVRLLDDAARRAGVVTHSSGNHAQALAWAARAAGARAVIVMPDDAPAVKIEATRALGAEVVLVPVAERESAAEEVRRARGATLVPPYDDAAVIAGQGTVGLEIADDLPEVGTVLVPVSGGGLISGIAAAVKARSPRARVVGVEPELAGDLAEGFAVGRRTRWTPERTGRTVADGLRVTCVGELPWEHISVLVDDVVTVTEDALLNAMRRLAFGSRLVAEPSGAAATAAYLTRGDMLPAGPVVAVVSGGNVQPDLLARVLQDHPRLNGVPA
ncbi:MAG: threonine/serine dehydratase [Actinomycetota bacterium]|nr:threonine/serine dehydratase [Actinomycetota bacterium]